MPESGITMTFVLANVATLGRVNVKLTVFETSPLNCNVATMTPPLVPLAVKLNALENGNPPGASTP